MVSRVERKREEKPPPPSGGLSFMVGLMLFSILFCPGVVFMFYIMNVAQMFLIPQFQTLTLGCLAGIVLAIIPAMIFMRAAMKRVKDY